MERPGFLERLNTLQPAVVRGIVVAVAAVILLITGKQVDDATVDTIVNIVLLILPFITSIWIKRAVTPNAKVIAMKPNPIDQPNVIEPGQATIVGQDQIAKTIDAAIDKAA